MLTSRTSGRRHGLKRRRSKLVGRYVASSEGIKFRSHKNGYTDRGKQQKKKEQEQKPALEEIIR